ncbi:MAG TPA: FHA domain-containing protein [Anaerolineae bacterium]|nr:FHA domain-containing protein [Anaerolineae bacterium]
MARAHLVIRWPDGELQTLPLRRGALTLGRHPTNDVVVPIPTVSAEHALIEEQVVDGRRVYRVVDRGSRNGTFVNGRRISTHSLRDGDIIRIGDALGNSIGLTYQTGRAVESISLGEFNLGETAGLTIGRDPSNDLHLDSPVVSRMHAHVERADAGHVLTDLGSTNGTYVNGRRLDPNAGVTLQPGDVVQIGPFRLTYQPTGFSQAAGAAQARIDALNLTRRVDGSRLILNDVSLSILPREFVAIVGGSGTGKTTLLDALSGFRRVEGRVLLNGDDFYTHYALYRNLLGVVPQDDIIHAELPVDRALRYVAQLRLPSDTSPEEIEQRVRRVLAEVEMAEQREQIVAHLSGGQRKRVSIGAELIAEPSVFLLDEATSGLDPGLEKKLMYTLRRMADAGRTIVLVTHATANIRQCDHVAFLGDGRLVFFGPPAAALDFFGVGDFADIYAEIERDPALWETRFRASAYAQQYIETRLSARPDASHSTGPIKLPGRPRIRFLRQFAILTQRTFELALRDTPRLVVLLAVMPVIGLLLSLLAEPTALVGASAERIADILHETHQYSVAAQAQTLLMMLALAAALSGMFVASFELVRERAVYRRERMINLRLMPYLGSKAVVLIGFALIQCLALIVAVGLRVQFPQLGALLPAPLEIYLTLALAAAAGTAIGLFISAVVNTAGTAVYVVLFALFTQIMFAGVIFELPGFTRALSYLTVTRWTVEALGSTVDLPALNDLGQIELSRTVEGVDPVTGARVQREVTLRDRLRVDFNVNYGHTPAYVLERWGVLLGFCVVFSGLSVLAQRQRDKSG